MRALGILGLLAATAVAMPAGALPPAWTPVPDPLEAPQWSLAMIRAEEAWALLPGPQDVVVASIDSGADLAHADLVASYWDGNAMHGASLAEPYGYFARLPVGADTTTMDEQGHGTLVSGVLAASPNGLGIRGVVQGPLMIVKFHGLGAIPDVALLAESIRWAVDHGAGVVSVSQIVLLPDADLEAAVLYAEAHDVVVVASSGNDGAGTPNYPAAYPTVVSVGAVDASRAVWHASNWAGVDLVAPGVDVVTTALGNGYASVSGTSLAAPHVAGVAALVRAADPTLTAAEVRAVLYATASPLADPRAGHGIVDAAAAVQEALA